MVDTKLLGTGGIVFLAIYLLSLLLVGAAGRMARRENSMADFFLSGRNMGLGVLFMTLYATQYSGNTLIGFAGEAYRDGFRFLVSVTFMTCVVGAYLLYAPKLHRLSRKHEFITVGDYVQHRYGSALLTLLVSGLGIVALGNYVLTNLVAIGRIVESATGLPGAFLWGIIGMSIIMVVYETLGGLRSVAWTDVIQGVLLMAGCLVIFGVIQIEYGGLSTAAETLMSDRPDVWVAPDAAEKRQWLSRLALVFFGISMYPHAIQRFYAARDEPTLRRSLQIMAFMPLVTTFLMVVVGIVGAARFPGLEKNDSDNITLLLLQDMVERFPALRALVVLFLSAAVAAIMSTVDSALLAISSMFTQDIYRQFRPDAPQARLTAMGKRFSWLVMALMVVVAITQNKTIWRLVEIKLELLCQVAPAIMLGLHVRRLTSHAVLAGLVVGCLVTVPPMLGLIEGIPSKPWGIHFGVWGLIANFATIGVVSLARRRG